MMLSSLFIRTASRRVSPASWATQIPVARFATDSHDDFAPKKRTPNEDDEDQAISMIKVRVCEIGGARCFQQRNGNVARTALLSSRI
jgi:hypothetical protein